MPRKETAFRNAIYFFAYLFLVWGIYRFLYKLPEDIEELFLKPIIWLIPVFFLLRKEKSSISTIGISGKGLFASIYWVLGLGVLFAIFGLLINIIKYRWVHFGANIGGEFYTALIISVATAISEEIAFRGYVYTRLKHALGGIWIPNLLSSFLWSLVHLPVSFLWWQFNLMDSLTYLFLTFVFGVGASYVFAKTKNIIAPIFLHFLWEWPIILFR
ncbi:MAG: CPBP family intramembrane metalloprotease [Patescibacteria group bacterium]|nr:CPBP family intramembrane metalloprotease [Patescibacteria group bacterium]